MSVYYHIIIGIVLSSVVRCEEYGNSYCKTNVLLYGQVCMFLSRDLVCNWSQPLVCDNNTQKHHSYYYYNNSCQLVSSNCHFSNSSYLFNNISHCTAVCNSNVTSEWVCVCVTVYIDVVMYKYIIIWISN